MPLPQSFHDHFKDSLKKKTEEDKKIEKQKQLITSKQSAVDDELKKPDGTLHTLLTLWKEESAAVSTSLTQASRNLIAADRRNIQQIAPGTIYYKDNKDLYNKQMKEIGLQEGLVKLLEESEATFKRGHGFLKERIQKKLDDLLTLGVYETNELHTVLVADECQDLAAYIQNKYLSYDRPPAYVPGLEPVGYKPNEEEEKEGIPSVTRKDSPSSGNSPNQVKIYVNPLQQQAKLSVAAPQTMYAGSEKTNIPTYILNTAKGDVDRARYLTTLKTNIKQGIFPTTEEIAKLNINEAEAVYPTPKEGREMLRASKEHVRLMNATPKSNPQHDKDKARCIIM